MKKIHCLNPIASCGTDLFPADYELTDTLAEADGVLVRSASMHEMELPEGLLAIGRAGAGVNNIPLEACAEKGIVVFNTPGANANGVKELVIAGLLMASRDIPGGLSWCKENAEDANITKDTEKSKKAFAGWGIRGKKVGVVGSGAYAASEYEVLKGVIQDVTVLTDGEAPQFSLPCDTRKIARLEGGDALERVVFEDGSAEAFDGLFIACGTAGAFELSRKLGLETANGKIVTELRTNTWLYLPMDAPLSRPVPCFQIR